jgi:hypothetical protein
MNPFEEKLHALKVAYKADKAIAWEEYRAKSAELKNQLAIVSGIKGVPTLHCVPQGKNFPPSAVRAMSSTDFKELLKADRDRKLSKFGRTYHFMRKETLAEMETFYQGGAI